MRHYYHKKYFQGTFKSYFTGVIFLSIIFFGIFGLAENSQAAPSVTNVSGTVEHGQNITISGSGFGTKSIAAPISWDDFEAQIAGNTVANTAPVIGPNWTLLQGAPGTDPLVFDNTRSVSGTKSVKISWLNESINAFGWANQGPYTQLYISYWRYQTGTYTQGINNHKQFYIFGNVGSNDEPQWLSAISASMSTWTMWEQAGCAQLFNLYDIMSHVTYDQTKDAWNRWEYWLKLNTPNTADGVVQEWVDGTQIFNPHPAANTTVPTGGGISNYTLRCPEQHEGAENGEWTDFRLGNMFQGPGAGAPEALKEAWFDDLYIDTTPARVEICSGSAWTARGSCAIQLPSTWDANGDEIMATVNLGALAGDTAYLYVCDADNACNATGYEVTLGGEPDVTPPAAPSGLAVN